MDEQIVLLSNRIIRVISKIKKTNKQKRLCDCQKFLDQGSEVLVSYSSIVLSSPATVPKSLYLSELQVFSLQNRDELPHLLPTC